MTTSFPLDLDDDTNLPSDRVNATPEATNHPNDHNNLADAVVAIETKVGVNGSADPTSLDAQLAAHEALPHDADPESGITTVMHVRPTGNNANSGLSWTAAKLDILGAFDELPAAGGLIYFETGTRVDAANTDRGFWLLGANDSNFNGSLPTGWRQQKGALSIIGVPTVSVGGSRRPSARLLGGSATDTAKPLLWFSGCDQEVYIENVAADIAHAQAMQLGKDSGTGAATNNAGFVFDNLLLSSDTGNAAHGPCVDITSVYWAYFRDCTFSANDAVAKSSNLRANMLLRGNSIGHGLIYISDTNFNRGGGFVSLSVSGGTNIELRNIVQEGADDPSQAIYWQRSVFGTSGGGAVIVSNCAQSDSAPGSDQMVVVAEGNDPSLTIVEGGLGTGPMTHISGAGSVSNATSLGSNRAIGIQASRLVGINDSARRLGGLAAVRASNYAAQDVSTWGALPGAAVVATGKSAPDGTTNAAELSGASADRQVVTFAFTIGLGDWFIAGVWMRAVDGVWPSTLSSFAFGNTDFKFSDVPGGAPTSEFLLHPPFAASSKEWTWVPEVHKISAVGGTGWSNGTLKLRCHTGAKVEYYAPVLLHIPTGAYPDAEVLEIARHLAGHPDGAPVGSLSTLRGQIVIARGGIGVGNAVAASALGNVVGKHELFDETGASLGFQPIFDVIT